jgi:hypothetical protein
MDSPAPSNLTNIVTHAVLAGLTPLIPLPVVDDLILNYFRRRMVRRLARAHGLTLPAKVTDALTTDHEGGFLRGCLTTAIVYPLKSIFRKIFYFLEWKRMIDLTSRTIHDGYLIDHAFAQGWLAPDGPYRPEQVSWAIHQVCREAPIKPVEAAVRIAFRQSRRKLVDGARLLERQFRRLRKQPDEESISVEMKALAPEEEKELAGVVAQVENEIGQVSAGHFQQLKDELARRLSIVER